MITATAKLEGISPYSQSKHYKLPKANDGKESPADYEERTWRERLHVNNDGYVIMPPMSFKNCISECAKYKAMQIPGKGKATFTKHFEAGVLVTDPVVLPIKKEDVPGEWLFVPSSGKRGDGSRVEKCFPVIHQWSAEVTFYVLDETITEPVFREHLEDGGKFIGLGRFRPRNNGFYGRFKLVDLKWDKNGH